MQQPNTIVEYFAWNDFPANYYFIILISISRICLVYAQILRPKKIF